MPLVLLPGMLCDAELWEHQTRTLAEIAAPSVGDLTQDDSIATMAERVLQAAPSRFVLAGLSLGAIVACEVMRRASERIVALALLDTNPAAPDNSQIVVWHEEIEMVESGFFARLVEERWIPSLLAASGSRGVLVQDVIRRMARRIGPQGYVRQLRAQIGRPDSWSSLAAIACPTLVLGGRQDTLCPPALQTTLAAAIPTAHLRLLEDCGHLSTLEQPEAVTALLRSWLEEVASRHATAGTAPGGERRA